jgi:hypothetical protein
LEPILSKASKHSTEIINELVCKKILSKIVVNNGKIEVPLGKRHGISMSSLAVTQGDQTPFNVLSVERVLDNKSILIPLNSSAEPDKFNGRTIQFFGKM